MNCKKCLTRILSAALALSLLFTLLAACSGGNSGGSNSGGSSGGSSGGGNSSGSSGGSSGESYKLSMTIHDPATSAKTQKYMELADKTREATDGKLDITVYPGGTLVASTDVADGVAAGSADMGWLFTTFFPGQFPLTEVVTLPMMFENHEDATDVLLKLYEQSPELQAELSDYKVLNLYCNPINHFYTTKPVESVADLKGMQIRATAGVATDMVTAWGGSPILMGPGDMYQSIEKGVLNGMVFEWSGFNAFRLGEVTKYCTNLPICCGVFLCVMNKDSYDKLPAEYQQVIDEIWGDPQVSREFADVFTEDEQLGLNVGVNDEGMTVIDLSDAATAEFKAAADEYVNGWVEKQTTSSFDAQAYLDLMMSIKKDVEG